MTLPVSAPRLNGLFVQDGQGLVELLVAMLMFAIAVTALFGAFASSAVSLQRAGQRATALTLADRQLELYRTMAYKNIALNATLVANVNAISPADPYKTANAADNTIPSSTVIGGSSGMVVNGTSNADGDPEQGCPTTAPDECQPTRVEIGPDQRSYRVDTYITYITPASGTPGRQTKQVTVVIRNNQIAGKQILARNISTFDQSNVATG